MKTDMPKSELRDKAQRLQRVLDRLLGEWRQVRPLVHLRASSTWSQVAEKLKIDRGSAQRLVRIGRSESLQLDDLELVPGSQAWEKITAGVEAILGADHPMTQRLASAVDRYTECLSLFGGSRASAGRLLQSGDQRNPPTPSPGNTTDDFGSSARQRMVSNVVDYMGYCVDLRFYLLIMRPSPSKRSRIDLTMVNCFLGCSGRPDALPFAHSRHGCSSDGLGVESGVPSSGRSFVMLKSGTSAPPPGLLSTGDATSQTIIVEPNWADSPKPMNLSFMQVERDAQDSPWLERPYLYHAEILNRYPVRRLFLQYMVHRDLHQDAAVTCAPYVTRRVANIARPWFDRLPEPAQLIASPPPFKTRAPAPFPRYHAVIDEVFTRNQWDPVPYYSYNMDVLNPIPFVWYSFELDREQ